jgi:cellulase
MRRIVAKVDDAVTADASSLDWFKIAEDGPDLPTSAYSHRLLVTCHALTNRVETWGSQNLIANEGWTNVTLPLCLASGNYLIRSEVYSLHDAGPLGGGTQHFLSCAQLNVVDGGSWTGSNFVKFPGE